MRSIIMLAAIAFAWLASAQTTTMQVPQGSGNYATIGQIECLEEEGSGRYCAATWECADGSSGELWRDMENHNGRRTIVPDHPIANRRDCTVEVDGKAAAQWFHGFRPQGRDGSVVGIANAVDAVRPMYEMPESVTPPATAPSGSMLAYVLERDDTTLREAADELCPASAYGDAVVPDLDSCLTRTLATNFAERVLKFQSMRATPWRQCMAEQFEENCGQCRGCCDSKVWFHLSASTYIFRWNDGAGPIPESAYDNLRELWYLVHSEQYRQAVQGDFSGCWALAVEEVEQLGMEVQIRSAQSSDGTTVYEGYAIKMPDEG